MVPGEKRAWLTVEGAFVAHGRGVLIEPRFVPEKLRRGTFEVTLRSPSGVDRTIAASLDVAHSRGQLAPYAMLRLYGLTPEEIEIGSTIWVEEEAGG